MSEKTQLSAKQMKGIGKLLTFLEKWDEGDHGLYAKMVLSVPVERFEEPDNDVGIITLSEDDTYVFQGLNVDVKGIVKENYSCKGCGKNVEIYKNVGDVFVPEPKMSAEPRDTSMPIGEWGRGPVTDQDVADEELGPYVSWDREKDPGKYSPRMKHDLEQLAKAMRQYGSNDGGADVIAAESVDGIPEPDWMEGGALPAGRTFSTFDGSTTHTVRTVGNSTYLGNVNGAVVSDNPNGFGNHE